MSRRIGAAIVLACVSLNAARAQPVADFYRGKTIELAVGAAVAGGYDIAARTLANHMSRHPSRAIRG
jgi:tripartite-type tricarboxylate transporter receptor subunit TctC